MTMSCTDTPLTNILSPIHETWFKPCDESINSPENKGEERSIQQQEKDVKNMEEIKKFTNANLLKCQSESCDCSTPTLRGFAFCYQHILEDKSSPFKRCSFFIERQMKQCTNSAPKLGDRKSYCMQHEEEMKNKNKNKKIRKDNRVKEKKRPSNLPLVKKNSDVMKYESSSEEEYSFFTDSSQVNKSECLWFGNQASDPDSTDSEDDFPLHHAGAWTLEECLQICENKISRLRHLYIQQFKRLNYQLREERRKMVDAYDMDPYLLSKVEFYKRSSNAYDDYVYDVHLTNYQQASGPDELMAEKQMKDRKTKGMAVHTRRNDLPRCSANKDTTRCPNKVLPFSRYCHEHIVLDTEQCLYEQCSHLFKRSENCTKPCNILTETCDEHTVLLPSASDKPYTNLQSAQKAREFRKRKLEHAKRENNVKERTRRASQRLEFKSPIDCNKDTTADGRNTSAMYDDDASTDSCEILTEPLSVEALLMKDIVESVVKETEKTAFFQYDKLAASDKGYSSPSDNSNIVENKKNSTFDSTTVVS